MSFWQKVKLVMSGIWTVLEPFVTQFLTDLGKILAEEAIKVVPMIAASMAGADGTAKREAAISQIKINLASRGIQATTTMILNAIQVVYTKLTAEGTL
jgi:hypothetical protein